MLMPQSYDFLLNFVVMISVKKYKILFVGDPSNFHQSLACGLRKLGHSVTVASDGCGWLRTSCDVDLSRPFNNKIGGLLLWLKFKWLMLRKFRGFDIVSVNGVCPMKLRPNRLASAFDSLRRHNRHIFMSFLGADPFFVEACQDPDFLRYSEWLIDGKPGPLALARPDELREWLSPPLRQFCGKVYNESEGVVAALYEYWKSARLTLPSERVGYGGIPIDTDAIKFEPLPENITKVRFFLGRHRERQLIKGTDRFEKVLRRLVYAYPDKAEMIIVENKPYDEYLALLRSAHVVMDQMYSYTPATNALLAMAMGKVAVSGGEPEFYEFINEFDNRPIINAMPDDDALFDQLRQLALHPERLHQLSIQSRKFVEKHNALDVVAGRFLDFWTSKINEA